MDQIRNINSIQIFSTVSHTRNVTRAAKLLNTSQSAVSYHIKKLETDLSVALFRRTASGLELTEEGAMLAAHVDRGLNAIRAGLEQVAARAGSVKVALLPMFASRWLSSRLGGLLEANPGLQLSIQSHNNAYARLSDPEGFADMGIQWGRGDWDRFHVTRLWPEKLVVVCSPAYLHAHPIGAPCDIERCTLLHVDNEAMWAEWFARNDLKLSGAQSQMMLEDRHFQLSSTINGLGVSLFASWLVRSELQSGELVEPFAHAFDTDFAYHLIVPKGRELPEAARQFKTWLLGLSRGA
ncbi:MAG: LysR family glycine cleavage system transcriptional activator [Paracoccaceae bacterium]|jgi:LysR family glycine cleavage system transcriptional activator